MGGNWKTIDGNEAAAFVAYKMSEVIAIYPITPSSPMGELSDAWSAAGQRNIWGAVPVVQEMQSEGGAAGAIHGALQGGALATTFTSSQGLLLMIPNMYKIAGELTPTVFHIAARSVATHALSIFGDHSDVMATRATGWAMLFSNNVQEVMDLGLIAHAATLDSRIPFIHSFDGFRTSHEVLKIEELGDDIFKAMIDQQLVMAHRDRSLSPDHPVIRGTAQNPDVFFQARERSNPYYNATPAAVSKAMDRFYELTGRRYQLFEYHGAPDADRVVIAMGSGCDTIGEMVDHLNANGEKVGLITVRLYRPFSPEALIAALPKSVRAIAVLDRTKEPGAVGEPLYEDVLSGIAEQFSAGTLALETFPRIIGGRYGLSSKEFTPAMVGAVYAELAKENPKNHFTVGIKDDVTHYSLDYDPTFEIERDDSVRALFYGLGADGTVGANRNSVKIIGEETSNYSQGYFVYDSKKSGARTVSHLRFGPRPIRSPYLIQRASFVAVHQFNFVERYNVLDHVEKGATFLLNSPFGPDEVWDQLPSELQLKINDLELKLYVIDAYSVAASTGMGNRINTIMQTCFFAISGVLPRDEAIEKIKETIVSTYKKRGQAVIEKNFKAVDASLAHLHEVTYPKTITGKPMEGVSIPAAAPEFVRTVTSTMIAGYGDDLPVSALPDDGTFPVSSARWEKRNIALEIPVWDEDLCIQCGKCVMVCPHSAIRASVYDPSALEGAPAAFKHVPARWRELPDKQYTLQVAVEDCTGCVLCVEVCPVKDKQNPEHRALNMVPQAPLREIERTNWDFFLGLPPFHPTAENFAFNNVKNIQVLQPLFEFSGACSGCGETPYVKLMSQLFGDRAVIANATGCSSIYGGNLPTTPWTTNEFGRGPAWSNSLFEDNAEFGLGIRLAISKQQSYAQQLVEHLRDEIGVELAAALIQKVPHNELAVLEQRQRVDQMRARLEPLAGTAPEIKDLLRIADTLVPKSVWIIGGDGWAYDIGYGGLDHVLASGENVNLLVLDTEVYSNTGGQASKATPLGAVAKFAAAGKRAGKKELGLMATEYGTVYVAQVAMGANDAHTVKAFLEAEAYEGPSLIIAYAQCIVHGIDMAKGMNQQKLAVESGYWPLFRYNPERRIAGQNPFQLDSQAPKVSMRDYAYNESRYRSLRDSDPEHAEEFMKQAEEAIKARWERLKALAS